MTAPPPVSVIIVSYGVRDLLRRCLASVGSQRGPTVETWVVDNASGDGSADVVASEFPGVHLIRNPENVGFARACNQALDHATGDPLLLLNPDTEIPPGSLAALTQVFSRHPNAGAAGFALRGPEGLPQPGCLSFPTVLNTALESFGLHRAGLRLGIGSPASAPTPREGEGEVDWVAGAFFAITRAALERVGGLSPESFMYGEEMDWSWRARQLGFSTVFSNAVEVLHHGGSSGQGLRGSLFVLNLEARLRFLRRYRGVLSAAIAREVLVLGSMLRLAYWWPRAALESRAGGIAPRTRDQVDRFRAVLEWRLGRAPR